MITDLDETIKQLLIKKVPLEPSEVDIVFEAPNRERGLEMQSRKGKEGEDGSLQFFDDLPFLHPMVAGNILNDVLQSAYFDGVMVRDGNGMLTLNYSAEPNMRTFLVYNLITIVAAQHTNKPMGTNISGEFHTQASCSSYLKTRRIGGIGESKPYFKYSSSDRCTRAASLMLALSSSRVSPSVKMLKPSALACQPSSSLVTTKVSVFKEVSLFMLYPYIIPQFKVVSQ
jgi:hypothetical protein